MFAPKSLKWRYEPNIDFLKLLCPIDFFSDLSPHGKPNNALVMKNIDKVGAGSKQMGIALSLLEALFSIKFLMAEKSGFP